MKYIKYLTSSAFGVLLLFGGWIAARAQTEITLDTPAPTRESFEKLLPSFESKTHYKVKVNWGNGAKTKLEAASGAPYDVFVILPPYDQAINSGNLIKSSGTTLGRFVMALTVKKGSPVPDLSSAATVKKALLDARSIATVDPAQGSVGVAGKAALAKMGIFDQVKSKVKYVPGGGDIGKSVLSGESEIGLGPYVNDLRTNVPADLQVVGPLPRGASDPTPFVAFVSTKAKDQKAAMALVKFLASPEAEAVYKSIGILPGK